MSSMLKKNEHKAIEPNSTIRFISDMSYGDDVDDLPTFVTPPQGQARKSTKVPRLSAVARFDLATMSISSSSTGSSSSAAHFPLDHRPINTTADRTLLPMRAFGNRDLDESLPIPTSADPETERHRRETLLNVPLPFSHDSIRIGKLPAILISEVDIDATLQKNLGMTESTKYLAIPATKSPPDSPRAILEGGFGSLMGVSMAIMQEVRT